MVSLQIATILVTTVTRTTPELQETELLLLLFLSRLMRIRDDLYGSI